MRFDIITIFPEVFKEYFNTSIIKRARERRLITIALHNVREYASGAHKSVDDKPYGGGAGMVMMAEPIVKAVEAISRKAPKAFGSGPDLRNRFRARKPKVIVFSAKGKQFNQKTAMQCAKLNHIIMICGRYEGIDERAVKILKAQEISIGPYVLTDGEVPAMAIVSAITRLIPGAIKFESLQEESYAAIHSKWRMTKSKKAVSHKPSAISQLEYPHYTRPETVVYKGKKYSVPKVLVSGHHKKIKEWRKQQAK